MTEYAKLKRNEYMRQYMRQYRQEHPEKIRQWNDQYWERKVAEAAERREKSEVMQT